MKKKVRVTQQIRKKNSFMGIKVIYRVILGYYCF